MIDARELIRKYEDKVTARAVVYDIISALDGVVDCGDSTMFYMEELKDSWRDVIKEIDDYEL